MLLSRHLLVTASPYRALHVRPHHVNAGFAWFPSSWALRCERSVLNIERQLRQEVFKARISRPPADSRTGRLGHADASGLACSDSCSVLPGSAPLPTFISSRSIPLSKHRLSARRPEAWPARIPRTRRHRLPSSRAHPRVARTADGLLLGSSSFTACSRPSHDHRATGMLGRGRDHVWARYSIVADLPLIGLWSSCSACPTASFSL